MFHFHSGGKLLLPRKALGFSFTYLAYFQVVDAPSLWNWMDEVLVPGLYDVTWYHGQPFEYQEGFISNKKNFLVGMPRFRQLRLKSGKATNYCHVTVKRIFFPKNYIPTNLKEARL